MKHPLSNIPMQEWLTNKIVNHLVKSEGCELIKVDHEGDLVEMRLRDVFGFEYALKLRLTGRAQEPAHLEKHDSKHNFFPITKV